MFHFCVFFSSEDNMAIKSVSKCSPVYLACLLVLIILQLSPVLSSGSNDENIYNSPPSSPSSWTDEKDCKPNLRPEPIQIIGTDADIYLSCLLDVHGSSKQGIYGCGNVSERGVVIFEAMKWLLSIINQNSGSLNGAPIKESLIPGVKLGEYFDTSVEAIISIATFRRYALLSNQIAYGISISDRSELRNIIVNRFVDGRLFLVDHFIAYCSLISVQFFFEFYEDNPFD